MSAVDSPKSYPLTSEDRKGPPVRLLVLTGLSGAGKGVAMHALEDRWSEALIHLHLAKMGSASHLEAGERLAEEHDFAGLLAVAAALRGEESEYLDRRVGKPSSMEVHYLLWKAKKDPPSRAPDRSGRSESCALPCRARTPSSARSRSPGKMGCRAS